MCIVILLYCYSIVYCYIRVQNMLSVGPCRHVWIIVAICVCVVFLKNASQ